MPSTFSIFHSTATLTVLSVLLLLLTPRLHVFLHSSPDDIFFASLPFSCVYPHLSFMYSTSHIPVLWALSDTHDTLFSHPVNTI